MKKQANINKLLNFFYGAHKNGEVCPTEVENFLQEFLKYIFDLNKLDLSQYDITISKENLTETHTKRAHEFKKECNKENRQREKRKILNKRGFNAYCANDYYEAIMRPYPTIANKYDIYINENICRAQNEDEFDSIIYFISIFGHEAHHIIQYIRHVKEMDRYDELLAINDINLKNASCYYEPRDARKVKRLIHQHISAMYSNCKSELYADKKGYDYLDILFNELFATLSAGNPLNLTQSELEGFRNFLAECQCLNEEYYLARLPYNKKYEKIDKKVCKKLAYYGYAGDDLEID